MSIINIKVKRKKSLSKYISSDLLNSIYKKAMINESLFGDTNFHWKKIASYLDI